MIEFSIKEGDILASHCDVLLLKHADGFHGVDKLVSDNIGFSGSIPGGEHVFLHGKNIEARKVLYLGVGFLGDFRYEQIRKFGSEALKILSSGNNNRVIASPLHGPGYGLDEREAFLSLVAGFIDAIENGNYPKDLQVIQIVENNEARAKRLIKILSENIASYNNLIVFSANGDRQLGSFSIKPNKKLHEDFLSYGEGSEEKPKVFVAMPFKEDYTDEWEIAIKEAVNASGILCERLDEQSYIGDILSQIKSRIQNSSGLLALLNESNPNVFLEVGYAWAKDKPTVLMLKHGLTLPFDVYGQKCIVYKNVTELRKKLTEELGNLVKSNTFVIGRKRTK